MHMAAFYGAMLTLVVLSILGGRAVRESAMAGLSEPAPAGMRV